MTARASDFFFPPGPTPGELASDFFIFIFFTVLPTAAPFLGHVLVTASVVGLRSGEYREEASLYVDGQGPGLLLLHLPHRDAHGGCKTASVEELTVRGV